MKQNVFEAAKRNGWMRRGAGKGVVWVLVAGGLLLGCEEPPPPQEIIRPVRAIKVQDTEAFAQR